jgi:hypothetical protein
MAAGGAASARRASGAFAAFGSGAASNHQGHAEPEHGRRERTRRSPERALIHKLRIEWHGFLTSSLAVLSPAPRARITKSKTQDENFLNGENVPGWHAQGDLAPLGRGYTNQEVHAIRYFASFVARWIRRERSLMCG